MEKRTPEQFLAEEGMTIDTARRIYSNILGFIKRNQHEFTDESTGDELMEDETLNDESSDELMSDTGDEV